MTPYIDTEAYREQIEQILKQYGLTPLNIDYAAPNIREYCKRNHIRMNDAEIYTEIPESRTAMNFRKDTPEKCLILFKKHISIDEAESVKDLMFMRKYSRKVHHLEDKLNFVKHLLLHEICEVLRACNSQGGDEETECDGWAFDEMGF